MCVHVCVCMCIVHREKEEDLEKRQFFINRELRPLMQLTGQQKRAYNCIWAAQELLCMLIFLWKSDCLGCSVLPFV